MRKYLTRVSFIKKPHDPSDPPQKNLWLHPLMKKMLLPETIWTRGITYDLTTIPVEPGFLWEFVQNTKPVHIIMKNYLYKSLKS